MQFQELDGPASGINGVNLKAVATTKYTSSIIDRRARDRWGASDKLTLLFKMVRVPSATAGVVKVTIQRVDDKGVDLGDAFDIVTAISTTADATEVIAFGGGLAPRAVLGTIDAEADQFRLPGKFKVIVEIVTASDAATSASGTLFVLSE